MTIATNKLFAELENYTKQYLLSISKLRELPLSELNKKQTDDSWSILECIEHLNLYGDFYLPEIEKRINNSNTKPSKIFKSGILGNYFAKSMLPKEKLNKMKTFKDKNPINSSLDTTTLLKYSNQTKALIQLLEKAKTINLTKTKTSITIPFVKLRLGDTLRFIIYHNERHMKQINNLNK